MPKITHVDKEYKMNFDKILNKPFLVTTIPWSDTAFINTELWRLPFPSSIMSNPLAKIPFNASTFFQARMCCMLQVSGTPMHQGLILVAAVPHSTPQITNPNQILSAPHVFLNANEATSVCLECPMYYNASLVRTQDSAASSSNLIISPSAYGTDVFDLVFFVMDPLAAATGSSTTISISVHNIFKDAEFYVPKGGLMTWQPQCGLSKMWGVKAKAKAQTKCACGNKEISSDVPREFTPESLLTNLWRMPTRILDDVASGLKTVTGDLIDYGRGVVKELTGFHNPNSPIIKEKMIASFRNFPNNVDQPVHLEVLDNHAQFSRVYDDYYFRTDQDEMDLKFLTSKPVFVGKFIVKSTDTAGKNLFAYPITPMVEADVTGGVGNTTYYSPLRTIYEASRFWRGGLRMHIQAVCTNFHFCKIIVLKNYAMTGGAISSSTTPRVPAYTDIHNINTDTLEFSAGGQIQTIDLKYNSNLRQIECTKDFAYNAISHGIAYGYLVQPLTYNSNVPTEIAFNVYISGAEDLEFSGYAVDRVDVITGTVPTYPGVPNFFRNELGIYEIKEDGTHTGRFLSIAQRQQAVLEERKLEFSITKPETYTVADGDTWEVVSYITGNTVEVLRELNKSTHNEKSKLYNTVTGPPLVRGEKLKFEKCGVKNKSKPKFEQSCFKPESMEQVVGTNTLVKPSSQEEILNKEVPIKEDPRMAFRPNTSIRDYLRYMYPQATKTIQPTDVKNVVAFDLATFFYTKTNASMFQALSSLYYGLSGGIKLKFKITGATSASAIFAPPSSYCISGGYLKIYNMSNALPTDTNSLIDFTSSMTYNPTGASYTAPQIEMQDYTRPHNNAGSNVKSRPGSTFVLEMAIPNMNAFNFVGNAASWLSTKPVDTVTDLGVVYINFDASTDGDNYAQVDIVPFIGLNDEARLGFQVYAPPKIIRTFSTNTTPPRVCRSSIFRPAANGVLYPNGIPINPMSMIGSSYYFSS